MKDLTIEEKAKAYDDAIDKIVDVVEAGTIEQGLAEWLFPELKESEDERIRKELCKAIWTYIPCNEAHEYIKWLEKQGANSVSVTKGNTSVTNVEVVSHPTVTDSDGGKCTTASITIEQKFKVGDWVVFKNKHQSIYQIEKIENGYYILRHTHGGTFRVCILHDEDLRLWTIQDAKNGDVLSYVTDEEDLWIMIYWSLYEPYEGHVHYHTLLVNDNFSDKGTCCICIDNLKPATKEQRDLLFQKMKEAGYVWNDEKKELNKISHRLISAEAKEALYDKPTWSEEDEAGLSDTLWAIKQARTIAKDENDMGNLWYAETWLKSLKERIGG